MKSQTKSTEVYLCGINNTKIQFISYPLLLILLEGANHEQSITK